MADDKELKVKITGDSSQLGRESKQAVGMLNEVRSAALAMVSGFTGGLLGGGFAGVISSVVTSIGDKIRDAKELILEADRLNVDRGTAQAVRNLTEAGGIPVAEGLQGARKARSEALAGDPEYAKAFEKLGIALESIRDADPASLFYRIVDAMERFDPAAKDAGEKFAALGRVLGGRSVADALTPYALGGLFREQRLFGESGNIMASILSADPTARFRYKKDFESPGEFGVGDENKAARLRAENDQRAAAVKRSTLTTEQQILQITAQRAALEEKIAETSDVVKKERLRSDAIGLDAEKVRLQQSLTHTKTAVTHQAIQADEFAQRGLDIGGSRAVPALLERSHVVLESIARESRETNIVIRSVWE